VEWNRREGATAVSWIADKNGILHVVTIEDKGRMAADLHSGPRTTVDSESIWHRRGQTRQQQFTWNTQTKGMVAFWVLTTKQWTRFYTGRIAVTLAIPPAVWLWILAWPRVTARFANRRGICPQCGYDMRATPNRCPECGRLFPPTVNPDELAARLNEVR
jgi:hypothetical protein